MNTNLNRMHTKQCNIECTCCHIKSNKSQNMPLLLPQKPILFTKVRRRTKTRLCDPCILDDRQPSSTSRMFPRATAIMYLSTPMILTVIFTSLLAISHYQTPSSAALAARELVRRHDASALPVTALSTGSSSNNNNLETALKTNEIPQGHHHPPQVPPNYVKLGNNNPNSHVRNLPSNLIQLNRAASTSATNLLHSNTSDTSATNSNAANINNPLSTSRKLPEKICIGTSNRLSGQSNRTDHYQNLVERYRDCTHVIGNLEITWLERGPGNRPWDLTFLESIREITGYLLIAKVDVDRIRLPNLLIIRGRELFKVHSNKDEFAMFVWDNAFKYLEMPNLREIINGNVNFDGNKNLCSVNTIDWKEILNKDFYTKYFVNGTEKPPECPACHNSCPFSSCWGPEEALCQRFSKQYCEHQCDGGRCFGSGPRDCCHMMCAGGCTGPKQTDCFACKNFNNEGECVPECPSMNKYNPSKFLWEPDPNGKHAYGASCVKECPDHLLRDNGACVRSCPSDKRSSNGECIPCAGPCPKNCQGVDIVNSHNIENFVNCTEIEGSLTILDTSFSGYTEITSNNTMGERHEPMHPSRLRVLETVVSITGYLNIQAHHRDFKDLAFLSKLEYIGGRQVTDMFLALGIIKTSLVSLNLRSLKKVKSGKILIDENKDLCYADTDLFVRANITSDENITIRNNADERKCRSLGQRCHEQCAPGGCWGPRQSECLACQNYKLENHCVNNCTSTRSLNILSFDAGSRTCQRCHGECMGGCSGVSARHCWQCKNFKDGPYCVSECPKHKYNDNGVCQECNKRCLEGCTGPSDKLGHGGCNVCDKYIVESSSNTTIQASCIRADEPCPQGYYQEYGAEVGSGHLLKSLERKPVCKKCHRKCKSCSGYGTHKDVCECKGYVANDQCEDSCPRDFYPDEKLRKCSRCSRECNGCFGPSEADCLNCRVYRIYYDSTGPVAAARVVEKANANSSKQQGRFNCTSQCPPEKPHRISESNLLDPYCSEDPGSDPDNPRIVSIGSTSFLFVLIVSAAIMFCVSVYRCQIEKNKTVKLTMQLSGIGNDVEPVEESNLKPNLAPLRSIKETELRKGEVLGSGFGGTVYQGFWYPDGQDKHKDPKGVAIKVLRDNGQANMNKEFLDEAYIMASVNHPNLVKLLAVCMTPKQLMLVTQLMPLGCLLDYVRGHKHTIGPKNLFEWGKQIAKGMAYLEEHRMVHRDLALRNVLVQTVHRVLISDFGLAKLLDVDQSEYHSGGGRLPIKWLAPECIREKKFTHKSDVWAFGVTIWELLTFGERPFEQYETQEVPMHIETGARLEQPSYVSTEVYKIMFACWFYNPEVRPDFKSLEQDFISFARDPERYLTWNASSSCVAFKQGSGEEEHSDEYDSDSQSIDEDDSPPHSAGLELLGHNSRMNEMMGFEMRQHNSDSATPNGGHVMTFRSKKINLCQPLLAEDVFSSQQISTTMGSSMTITDSNNNNNNNNFSINSNHGNDMRQAADSWWSVGNTISSNSLGHRSEQPTDSDDYLMPSPCSNEEKFTKFYEVQANARLPPRPRPPSSRDPPHSAGLIGISNDAYFITRGMRNYANSSCATNASSGHIPSSLV